MAHTPGPWKVVAGTIIETDDADGLIVATVPAANPTPKRFFEDRCNARLIAAAPDLLEALERARLFIKNGRELGFIQMPDEDDPAWQVPDMIDAALAKAHGDSN